MRRHVTSLNFWPLNGWCGWMTSKTVSAWSPCGVVDDLLQQHLRARFKAGGAAPEECVVLQDAARGRGGRPVYDADPHLPVMWRQLVRVSDGAAEACQGTDGQPRGVDALELPPYAGAAWRMMNPAWPKRLDTMRCSENGPPQK